jgi:hypothetical protein
MLLYEVLGPALDAHLYSIVRFQASRPSSLSNLDTRNMAFNLAQGNFLGTMLELFMFGNKSLRCLYGCSH